MRILRRNDRRALELDEEGARRTLTVRLLSTDASDRECFSRETAVAGRLSGAEGFPVFLGEGENCYRREFVLGHELTESAGRLDFAELLPLGAELARIVALAHTRGVILGDIKPANFILLSDGALSGGNSDRNGGSGRPVFVDFSLARELTSESGSVRAGGTPAVMAPELFYGGERDVASDLYALGATLFELTAGRPPFCGTSWRELAREHWLTEPSDPTLDTSFPPAWGCTIFKLLQKSASARFLAANDLIRHLNRVFGKDFPVAPETEALRRLLPDFDAAQREAETAARVVDTILADSGRSPEDTEFAARILARRGDDKRLDKILAELPEPVRLHIEATRDLRRGAFAAAKEQAEALLAMGEEKARNTLGACAYHAGDLETARGHFRKLVAHYRAVKNFAELIPVLNNLANVEAAADELPGARAVYDQSLSLARLTGAPRHQALALASQGSLEHRAGRWGRAFSHYESALRLYDWLGMTSEARPVRLNKASLMIVIGLHDEAGEMLAGISEEAREERDPRVGAHALLVAGDLARARGRREEAERKYRQGLVHMEEGKNAVGAGLARSALARIKAERGLEPPQEARELGPGGGEKLKNWRVMAPLYGGRGGHDAEAMERLCEGAQAGVEADDRLRILAHLWGHFRRLAREDKTAAYRRLFLEAKIKASEGLEGAVREKFDATYNLPEEASDTRYSRALGELSAKLIAELDVNELLRGILDKLIAYTGSERGFIILREDRGPRIAISRRFAKKDLVPSERELSWTLANRVLAEAKAVVTLDAQSDERFEMTESVHQLRLKTIICLPFVYRGEVLGAIYLDSQASGSSPREELAAALEPFAAQMAVAIFNARLFGETKRDLGRTRRELRRLKVASGSGEEGGVFLSLAMRSVNELARRVAPTLIPVLVTGESGVGKERVTRLIHELSRRADKPFVSVNCGAIPESLMESELFGYKKGAFTGADRDKKGLIGSADGGTLFLDEVGELKPALQVKFLRFLQEGEFTPLGTERSARSDARIVAATNRDLREEMRRGRFREDLFYRLHVAEIRIPPLRERREDIAPLARHFIKKFCAKENLPEKRLSPEVLAELTAHDWPGNVRELENLVYKLVVFHDGEVVTETGLPASESAGAGHCPSPTAPVGLSLAKAKKWFEKQRIVGALKNSHGNVSHAARELKVARPQLCALLREHSIDRLSYTMNEKVS